MVMNVVLLGILYAFGTVNSEPCPEGRSTCAASMTCCLLPNEQQGCCPYVNGTCCIDRVHCCPMGSTCDPSGGGHCKNDHGFDVDAGHIRVKQLKLNSLIPIYANTTQNIAIANEICGDGSQCPDEATCCQMTDGRFGCCPMPSAVCCSDQVHCCPSGTVCDQGGYCQDTVSFGSEKPVQTDCPGGEAKCPEGNTCCSLGEGEWGCCPMKNAVCCPDDQHCCPPGYHCLASGGCAKNQYNMPWNN